MSFPPLRTVLFWIVVAFIIYAVLATPVQSANTTGSAWDHIKSGITAITTYLNTLLDH